ncbi:MAG: c-type cytochrome [Burkholderiaceae bacterium]
MPIIAIILLANFVAAGKRTGAGTASMTPEAIAARIKPVAGFELRAADGSGPARSADEIYKSVCSACHAAGVAGAPKAGDAAAWAPRIATGLPALVQAVLKGKGAMPAQGGGEYSDLEIERTVVMLANQSGGKFSEPKQDESAQDEGTKDGGAKGEAKAEAKAEAKGQAQSDGKGEAKADAKAEPKSDAKAEPKSDAR